MPNKLTGRALAKFEAERNIWQEVLDGVREIKAGGGKRRMVEPRSLIVRARLRSGLTQAQIAALLGISKMSKTDRVKEEIGWLKVVFGILVATDISLIAWLAQNFNSASRIQVLVGLAAVVGVTGAVVWVNRMAYARIRQLEDL